MLKICGQMIRAKRKQFGYTIEELADKAHVSISYLARLERGELTDTTISKLDQVLNALDLNLVDVLLSDKAIDPALTDLIHKLRGLKSEESARIAKAILELLR